MTDSLTAEPRTSPKPQPLGNFAFIILFTTCTLCLVFILWRRANALRTVVSHKYVAIDRLLASTVTLIYVSFRLKTWTRQEGNIRLSVDDGPPANEFLADDFDEDHGDIEDDEPLADRAERLRLSGPGTTANDPSSAPRARSPNSPIITLA